MSDAARLHGGSPSAINIHTPFIAIDGPDGSGKSTLAQQVAARFKHAVVLAVDDFRRSVTWDAPSRSEADIYYEDYFDFAALNTCLASLIAGQSHVTLPVWDPIQERCVSTRTLRVRHADAVIVEGVFARRLVDVRTRAATIYLHTPVAEAHRRVVARDVARGRCLEEVNRRLRTRYVPSQHRYIAEYAPADHAHVVLDYQRTSPRVLRIQDPANTPRWLLEALGLEPLP